MRKVCIVTGTRAEYGLLYWLMKEIQEDSELELQLIATGMHLSPEFGLTYRQIEKDGFKIDRKIEMLLSSNTPVDISKEEFRGIYWALSDKVPASLLFSQHNQTRNITSLLTKQFFILRCQQI